MPRFHALGVYCDSRGTTPRRRSPTGFSVTTATAAAAPARTEKPLLQQARDGGGGGGYLGPGCSAAGPAAEDFRRPRSVSSPSSLAGYVAPEMNLKESETGSAGPVGSQENLQSIYSLSSPWTENAASPAQQTVEQGDARRKGGAGAPRFEQEGQGGGEEAEEEREDNKQESRFFSLNDVNQRRSMTAPPLGRNNSNVSSTPSEPMDIPGARSNRGDSSNADEEEEELEGWVSLWNTYTRLFPGTYSGCSPPSSEPPPDSPLYAPSPPKNASRRTSNTSSSSQVPSKTASGTATAAAATEVGTDVGSGYASSFATATATATTTTTPPTNGGRPCFPAMTAGLEYCGGLSYSVASTNHGGGGGGGGGLGNRTGQALPAPVAPPAVTEAAPVALSLSSRSSSCQRSQQQQQQQQHQQQHKEDQEEEEEQQRQEELVGGGDVNGGGGGEGADGLPPSGYSWDQLSRMPLEEAGKKLGTFSAKGFSAGGQERGGVKREDDPGEDDFEDFDGSEADLDSSEVLMFELEM